MAIATNSTRQREETSDDVRVILLLNFKQFLCIIIGQLIGSNILVMLF